MLLPLIDTIPTPVTIHVVGLPTGVLILSGTASLLDHGACLWDTEYCNTSALSDLG